VARPTGASRPAAAPSLSKALAAAGKSADALIAKLDKNKDGFINEAELKPLMAKLDKITEKMGDHDDADADPTSADGRKALLQTRAKMNDADRLLMAVAQSATHALEESTAEKVSVKVLQKGVRTAHKEWVKAIQTRDGGLMGALGAMFAGILLPNDVLKAALK
jgi:hypothetical protein